MDKIFVPNLSDFECVYLQNNNTLRGYYTVPRLNSSSDYVDFAVDNHYLFRNGTQTWNNYSTLPECLSNDVLTDNFYYRTDFADILICFTVFSFFVILFPLTIFKSLFKRGCF